MEYSKLNLFIQDQTKKPIGCGYYYIVTNGGTSHTAFRTNKALKYWLKITGLKIGKRSHWGGGNVNLTGSYKQVVECLNNNEFFAKHAGKKTYYALCNGSYSIGFIDETPTGNVLYCQNPNTDRFILDYKKVTGHLETGKEVRFIY
jgi:hypothetical protein